MTVGRPAPTMTVNRFRWLKRLVIGPAKREGANRVGYDCMVLGWTEWNYINSAGEEMTGEEARARYGEQWWNRVEIRGERLTAAGREALDKC